MDHSQTVLYVLAFVLSLVFSGFFAGFRDLAGGPRRIACGGERGDRRGAIIRNLKAHTSRLLAVILMARTSPLGRLGLGDGAGDRMVRCAVRRDLSVLFDDPRSYLRRDDAQRRSAPSPPSRRLPSPCPG
jgi:hypothetical protein